MAVAISFCFQKAFECKHSTLFSSKKPIVSDWLFLVAGKDQIPNFLEGYELVVELWMYMNRQDD